jgi:hypothetical protein
MNAAHASIITSVDVDGDRGSSISYELTKSQFTITANFTEIMNQFNWVFDDDTKFSLSDFTFTYSEPSNTICERITGGRNISCNYATALQFGAPNFSGTEFVSLSIFPELGFEFDVDNIGLVLQQRSSQAEYNTDGTAISEYIERYKVFAPTYAVQNISVPVSEPSVALLFIFWGLAFLRWKKR